METVSEDHVHTGHHEEEDEDVKDDVHLPDQILKDGSMRKKINKGHSRKALFIHTENNQTFVSDHSPSPSPKNSNKVTTPKQAAKTKVHHKRDPSPSSFHGLSLIVQPFPERSAVDGYLCTLTELGLDWRCFDIDEECKVFAFPIESLKIKGKPEPDISYVSFEVRYTTASQVSQKDRRKSLDHSKGLDHSSPADSPSHGGLAKFISGFRSNTKGGTPKTTTIGVLSPNTPSASSSLSVARTELLQEEQDVLAFSFVDDKSPPPKARKESIDLAAKDDHSAEHSTKHHRKVSSTQFVLVSTLNAHKKDGKVKKTLEVGEITSLGNDEADLSTFKTVVEKKSGTQWEIFLPNKETHIEFENVLKCLLTISSPEWAPSNSKGPTTNAKERQSIRSMLKTAAVCKHQGFAQFSASPEFNTDFLGGSAAFMFDKTVYGCVFSGRLVLFDSAHTTNSAPFKVLNLAQATISELKVPEMDCAAFETTIDIRIPRHDSKKQVVDQYILNPGSLMERKRWITAMKQNISISINSHKRSESWSADRIFLDVGTLAMFSPTETLLEQGAFFNFVRDFVYPHQIICSTSIPRKEDWTKQLGTKEKRHQSNSVNKGVHVAYNAYQDVLARIWQVLKTSLLVCEDGYVRGDENIGFSHPGFENEVFQVASVSVLSSWSMFNGSGDRVALSSSGWTGCLSASSIAKELMQTLPDIHDLYENGQITLAKEITHEAVSRQLENLIIAQFIRYNRQDLYCSRINKFSWNDAVIQQKRSERTQDMLMEKELNTYHFNLSLETLYNHLIGRKELSNQSVALWTQLNWLDAIRFMHHVRLEKLFDLLERINLELQTNPDDLENPSEASHTNHEHEVADDMLSKREYFLKTTKTKLEEEQAHIEEFLNHLPSHMKIIEDYFSYCNAERAQAVPTPN